MALLTKQTVDAAGTVITYSAATGGGDTAKFDDDSTLRVKNGGGSSINVTISDPGTTPAGNGSSGRVVAVAGGAEKTIKVKRSLNNPNTGVAAISYSAVTSVTVAHVTQ